MAQGRFISRTIAIDPKLALLSETAELLYLKTIPHLDRDGLCHRRTVCPAWHDLPVAVQPAPGADCRHVSMNG